MPRDENEILHESIRLTDLVKRVEYGLNQQKQFSSEQSRELRTYLTAIRGMLEVLIRRRRDSINYEDRIREVLLQVEVVTMLIEKVFLLSWLNSDKVEVRAEPLNLKNFMDLLEDKWHDKLNSSKINLYIRATATLSADTTGDNCIIYFSAASEDHNFIDVINSSIAQYAQFTN